MTSRIFFAAFATNMFLSACNNGKDPSENINVQIPDSSASSSKVALKGTIIFEQKCSSCHGSDGTAGIGNAANLQKSTLDSLGTAKAIINGRGGMPSFGTQLTEEEIGQIADYVLTLRQ